MPEGGQPPSRSIAASLESLVIFGEELFFDVLGGQKTSVVTFCLASCSFIVAYKSIYLFKVE